jgi:hypothetical protein
MGRLSKDVIVARVASRVVVVVVVVARAVVHHRVPMSDDTIIHVTKHLGAANVIHARDAGVNTTTTTTATTTATATVGRRVEAATKTCD